MMRKFFLKEFASGLAAQKRIKNQNQPKPFELSVNFLTCSIIFSDSSGNKFDVMFWSSLKIISEFETHLLSIRKMRIIKGIKVNKK